MRPIGCRPLAGLSLLLLASGGCKALSVGQLPMNRGVKRASHQRNSNYVPSNLFLKSSAPDASSRSAWFAGNDGRVHNSLKNILRMSPGSEEDVIPEPEPPKIGIRKQMLAEFFGTYMIVQLGTGAVMSAVFTGSLSGIFQIGTVFSIAVMLAICVTGSISGAHLNPAISIAFALLRSFQWNKVIPYIIAQLAGAILGSWTNLILYGSSIKAFEAANGISRMTGAGIASAKAFGEYFADPVSLPVAFLAEAIGTGILSFVIFALTNPKNETTKDVFLPPLIGATVGALICVFAPLTQAGFNPARDFGPRIVAYLAGYKTVAFKTWWVYVFGPIVGAVAGGTFADKVLYGEE